jgi:hypothetical protein
MKKEDRTAHPLKTGVVQNEELSKTFSINAFHFYLTMCTVSFSYSVWLFLSLNDIVQRSTPFGLVFYF